MQNQNLSAKRGNRFGITFFKLFMRLLGLKHARNLVWSVSLFYATFDSHAKNAAQPYLVHRFPQSGKIALWWHTYCLLTAQGQALLTAAYAAQHDLPFLAENKDEADTLLNNPAKSVILLASHFGEWQASIRYFSSYSRDVSILVEPDVNLNVDKFITVKSMASRIKPISTAEPWGGLLSVMDALENHHAVCIMGDRNNETKGIKVKFLGDDAIFPIAAFHCAAKFGTPIIPMVMVYDAKNSTLVKHFGHIINVSQISSRCKPEMLRAYVQEYADFLTRMAELHPYSCFIFANPWRKI